MYALTGTTYEAISKSALLPELDLDLLASFVTWENQTAAVRAYRDALLSPLR